MGQATWSEPRLNPRFQNSVDRKHNLSCLGGRNMVEAEGAGVWVMWQHFGRVYGGFKREVIVRRLSSNKKNHETAQRLRRSFGTRSERYGRRGKRGRTPCTPIVVKRRSNRGNSPYGWGSFYGKEWKNDFTFGEDDAGQLRENNSR